MRGTLLPSISAALAVTLFVTDACADPLGYYRQPSIQGDTIVFVAEGDLWKVGAKGGVATRLTSHAGDELSPRISPDGAWVAFTGQYEGPTEVYVMPLAGGLPKRLTYDGVRATVAGWKGTGADAKVIASTTRFSTLPSTQLTLIQPGTGERELVPLAQAADGSYDDSGGTLFFTRLQPQGSQTKRYKGGTAQNLWKFTEGAEEAVALTPDFAGTSTAPMWFNGRVYFLTDRDGTMEVWSMDGAGKDLRQHTDHGRGADAGDEASPARYLDARGAALSAAGGGRIVYQFGADLWLYDIASDTDARLDITLDSDFDQTREVWVKEPMTYLSAAHVSPDGERVAMTARGQVFVAPKGQGRLVEVTRNDGVRYRDARFMPDGKRLLVMSDESGEVEFWSFPANGVGKGERLTKDGVVLRWEGVPSPDGRYIAHDDKNQRLWIFDTTTGEQKQIDENGLEPFSGLAWSADSRWLAYAAYARNFNRQVKLHDTTTSATTFATTDRFDSYDPAWSPDGKWLYLLSDRTFNSVVQSPWGNGAPEPFFDKKTRIYQVALRKGERSPFAPRDELTPAEEAAKGDGPATDPVKPAPDRPGPDQKPIPDPSKEPPTTQPAQPVPAPTKTEPAKPEPTKPEPAKPDPAKPDPAKSEPAPLEGSEAAAASDAAKAAAKAKAEPPKPVEIDIDGLAERLVVVPVPAGNYADLAAAEKRLFWLASEAAPDSKPSLMFVEVTNKDPKPKSIAKDLAEYELSADRKWLMLRRAKSIAVIEATSGEDAKLDEATLKLEGWTFPLVPREEWGQMFVESWRLLRDYFYDTDMHGVDWPDMLSRYRPLADRVSTRAELSDLMSQLTGELSTLHHFVYGGDLRQPAATIRPATLGAMLVRDEAAGGFRVGHVYATDPDDPEARSPLRSPGVDIAEGDVILQINGRDTLSVPDPSTLLRNQAGRQVLVRVRSGGAAARAGAADAAPTERDVIVVPLSTDADAGLRYSEWEHSRRLKVEKDSGGDVGYVHLRAMGTDSMAEFVRGFYPVFDRKGLIIDVRHNRGGNIDSWILSRLLRKAWFFWQPRIGQPYWNMQFAFRGHVVVLCNELTASDGEAFSEGIKRLDIGEVIGTRTWGGEVWLSSSNTLVDGGIATAAEIGVYGPEGDWLIEGHGVEPDQVVDNLPHATFKGEDAQLDAALAYLKRKIQEQPVEVPKTPRRPNKSFRPEGDR